MSAPRRIVLTGASRGLGRAMLEGFIELGHTVYGCSRSAAAVDDLTRRFHALGKFAAVDVSDDDAVDRWASSVLADGGPPDLLLNNAALMNTPAPLWKIPPDEFRAMAAANINGVYYVVRHFVPAMVDAGRGVIVNFTSGWGRTVSPEVAPYCATKWGVEGLTRALAMELPAGMAAVPLNPGIIDTDMLRTAWGDGAAAYPSPEKWGKKVVPFLLNLTGKDNGKPLTAPSSMHPAALPLEELLRQCAERRTKRSGPGGQHRNKVETAVILTHTPTGVSAEASERRSQTENRRVAVQRLRVNLALEIRTAVECDWPPSSLWSTRRRGEKISVSVEHEDFPAVLAEALDRLHASAYDVKPVADQLGVTASQLVKLVRQEPRGGALLNRERAARGLATLK